MKKFDIKKAKNGSKVCTRNGGKVRILCFDVKGREDCILALVYDERKQEETEIFYYPDGRRFENKTVNSSLDLFLENDEDGCWLKKVIGG